MPCSAGQNLEVNLEVFTVCEQCALYRLQKVGTCYSGNNTLSKHFIRKSVLLRPHAIVQSANHVVAVQCIISCKYKTASVNAHIKDQKGKDVISVSLTVAWLLIPDGLL